MKFLTENDDAIRAKRMELEKYPGLLPGIIQISPEFDLRDWHEFLIKEGLWNEEFQDKLHDQKKQSYEEEVKEFIEWVEKHPEYSDFIIWGEE